MLRAIVEEAVSVQADMELISAVTADLGTVVRTQHADVVIASSPAGEEMPRHSGLLLTNPTLKLFVVTPDGREGKTIELRQESLADLSSQALIDAIRTMVVRDRTQKVNGS